MEKFEQRQEQSTISSLSEVPAIVLFSGGKDCIYSLEKVVKSYNIVFLVTSINEEGDTTYTDGLEAPGNILNELIKLYQNELIFQGHNTEIVKIKTNSKNPTEEFYNGVITIAKKNNIKIIVTGDLEHDEGVDKEFEALGCTKLGIKIISPAKDFFKKNGQKKYMVELFQFGLRFIISAVRRESLPIAYIGREINMNTLQEILRKFPKLDVTGEDGEFQTLVTDSSFLKKSIIINDFKKSNYQKGRDSKAHFYARIIDIKYEIRQKLNL